MSVNGRQLVTLSGFDQLHTHVVNTKEGSCWHWSRTFALKNNKNETLFVHLNLFERIYANVATCCYDFEGYFKRSYAKLHVTRFATDGEVNVLIYQSAKKVVHKVYEDGESLFVKIYKQMGEEATKWCDNITLESHVRSLSGQKPKKDWWGIFAKEFGSTTLGPLLEWYIGTKTGVALDIGCGKSETAFHLLEKGWTVICIDNSKGAISEMEQSANAVDRTWIKKGKLICIRSDIETYKWKTRFDLVVASSVLPYLDPKNLKTTMDHIHTYLNPGGYFVGNFFSSEYAGNDKVAVGRKMGASFIEGNAQDTVGYLLAGHGYDVQTCARCDLAHPDSIMFVAQKEKGTAAAGSNEADVKSETAAAPAPVFKDPDHKD